MKTYENTSRLAFPITSTSEKSIIAQRCSFCNSKPGERILKIEMQTNNICPKVIISILNSDIEISNLFDYEMQLTDAENDRYQYRTKSLLFISKYSNNITVLRRDDDLRYIAYRENPYSQGTFIDDSELMSLYDTASNVLIFLNQVNE
jgi:hypothetical protein